LDWGQDLPGLRKWIQEHPPTDGRAVYFSYYGSADPSVYKMPVVLLPGYFDPRPYPPLPVQYQGGLYCISQTNLMNFQAPWTAQRQKSLEQIVPVAQRQLTEFQRLLQDAPTPEDRMRLVASIPDRFWEPVRQFDNLRLGRICAYIRRRKMPAADNVGHSILIFRLSDQEVREAMFGPPVEQGERLMVE
jgi:hypothetical protein